MAARNLRCSLEGEATCLRMLVGFALFPTHLRAELIRMNMLFRACGDLLRV
jgi:hypothetical protein